MISPPEWLSKPRCIAGAMSGTSLDGVDAAIVRITQRNERAHLELLGFANVAFSREIRSALEAAIERPISIAELSDLACMLMQVYADALARAIADAQQHPEAIGIHGQTLWHAPTPHVRYGVECRTTFQLAEPAILAQRFGIPIVSNVRAADVALGGEGAPLVPILDWELLRSMHEYTIALNIGGIANITLLPPGCSREEITAFDTGPGNVWIDRAMHHFWGLRYDDRGRTAAAGKPIPALFEQLTTIPFITAPPPKSAGREIFSAALLDELLAPFLHPMLPAEDIIATLTAFTAWSIAENIRRFGNVDTCIVVSGGGAKNATLLAMLQSELPSSRIIHFADRTGIPDTAKEAVLMAYLAYRTLGELPSNLPSVTGAHKQATLGSITLP
ncbi:Anhydro-N-acetylmuramic acid kinase [bacterium HR20]|nr:Anhydro-N-acetylmuramic acid kinase [bacterium HR20]